MLRLYSLAAPVHVSAIRVRFCVCGELQVPVQMVSVFAMLLSVFCRPVARRLQNMGWTPDNKLWVSTRGGDVFVSPETGVSEKFDNRNIPSRGFGILDVG